METKWQQQPIEKEVQIAVSIPSTKIEKILGNGCSLADPLQEMDGVGTAEIPLKCPEYILLWLENVILGVGWISTLLKEVNDWG